MKGDLAKATAATNATAAEQGGQGSGQMAAPSTAPLAEANKKIDAVNAAHQQQRVPAAGCPVDAVEYQGVHV